MKRNYKTIKWVLKEHIKKKVQSLWTWEKDNFTCLFNEYKDKGRIYTSTQLLKLLEDADTSKTRTGALSPTGVRK